jgi:hypothetical protein
MPLVTLTLSDSTPEPRRRALLDAVHGALVSVGVPAADRFQRVIALPPEAFVFDADYPDAAGSGPGRDARFAIVEVLWSAGRSVKVKKQLLAQLKEALQRIDFDPAQLMLVFKETTWENWSFARGELLHV